MSKFKTIPQLGKILNELRTQGKKIVFTNGCFDLLHLGHVRLLKAAKEKGDVLVVAINSDTSLRKLKGKARPLNSQKARAEILSALESVDYVTTFSQPTPAKIISQFQPDVLVKGGDWKPDQIVGAGFVRKRGGQVFSLPLVKGYSTTKILKRLKVYG